MKQLQVEGEIEAPLSDVWDLVSDFVGFLTKQGVDATGQGQGTGMTRTLTLGGSEVVERLEGIDHDLHRTSYSVISGPVVIPGYVGTIQLTSEGENTTRVIWSAVFDSDGAPEDAEAMIERTYKGGIKGMKRYFASK